MSGLLFTGDNTKDQLSFLPNQPQSTTAPTIAHCHDIFNSYGECIHSVVTGDKYTILLTESGRVFVTGSNSMGQIGLGTKLVSSITELKFPDRIIKIASKRFHSAFISDKFELYMCGNYVLHAFDLVYNGTAYVPTKLSNYSAIDVELGFYHFLFKSCTGIWYSGGRSTEGQTGSGTDSEEGNEIKPVQLQQQQKITKVSCGGFHSAFLDEEGHVWTCGINNDGQQGTDDIFKKTPIPEKLVTDGFDEKYSVCDIVSGYCHLAMLTSCKNVFVQGYNKNYQLGLDDTTSRRGIYLQYYHFTN
jgi:X-linked retinitis pigmentosa GTPase regulator